MTKRIRFTPFLAAGAFALVLGARPPDARAADVPFVPQPVISTVASGPTSVFAADIDGDGDVDLLSASASDDRIEWYENAAGDGSVWTARTISTAADFAQSVFTADVDGDGDTDVLSASPQDDKIAWYENVAGDGTAWTLRTIATDGNGARAVFAADVDGDGDTDALAASGYDDKIAWYENTDGTGSTWTPRTISTAQDFPAYVFAADVDGDGDTDLVAADVVNHGLNWYENAAGNGTAWTLRTIATLDQMHSVSAADVDGDGDVDVLACSTYPGQTLWYENTAGNGTTWTPRSISTLVQDFRSVSAADIDADGDVDVLTVGFLRVDWYENTAGNGTAWTQRLIDLTPPENSVAGLAADLDGDGDLDAVAATMSGGTDRVRWYRNETIHSSACFTTQTPIATVAGARWVFATDLDGDGDTDAVSTSLSGSTIAWHENAAGDGSSWTGHTVSTAPTGAYSVFAADVDGDGDPDVLSSAFLDRLDWHENVAGNGSAWTPHTITTAPNAPVSVFGADVDGDGDMDALSASQFDDTVAWYENVGGNGTTWTPHTITTSANSASSVFGTDVDGDGDVDALSASYADNKVAWYENTAGNGSTWTTHTITTTAVFADSVFAADVDGDGDMDALSASGNDFKVAWYENAAGNGSTWVTHTITTAADVPFFVFAADLDGDGDVDALSASIGPAGRVEWYENVAGNGSTWTAHTVSVSANGTASVFAADVDGDGRNDVVSALYFDSTVAWHPDRGGQFSLAATDTAPPSANNGDLVSMLRIDAAHQGRGGDHDLELASLGFLFEESPGDPLTTLEFSALVSSVRVYRDSNGNGVFDPGADALVFTLISPPLTGGVLSVLPGDGDPNFQVAFGATRTYFLVVELAPNASQQSPNQFRVTHLGLGASASTAEDRDFDIPLRPACPLDVASSILGPIVPVELIRFTVE